jgi:large subunit ribosomal protein L15
MGSGMGKTSARGHKGQRSRSGSRMMRGFEGGQMPLHRRVPKRGFNNIFRQEYQIVDIESLATLGAKDVTPDVLHKAGLIKKPSEAVKILGDGEIKIAISVSAHRFSKSAQEKITKAGGKVEIIGGLPAAAVKAAPAAKPAPAPKAVAEAKPAAEAPKPPKQPKPKKP